MPNRLTTGEALVGQLTTVALTVSGETNLGGPVTLIADPTGGATQDAESRTAIVAIIAALTEVGLFSA